MAEIGGGGRGEHRVWTRAAGAAADELPHGTEQRRERKGKGGDSTNQTTAAPLTSIFAWVRVRLSRRQSSMRVMDSR